MFKISEHGDHYFNKNNVIKHTNTLTNFRRRDYFDRHRIPNCITLYSAIHIKDTEINCSVSYKQIYIESKICICTLLVFIIPLHLKLNSGEDIFDGHSMSIVLSTFSWQHVFHQEKHYISNYRTLQPIWIMNYNSLCCIFL